MDTIENKVAFGLVFDDAEINQSVNAVLVEPGCVHVLVDGIIQGDALVPVPIPGEIEKVSQAVGSQVAWPQNLITFTSTVVCISISCPIFFPFFLPYFLVSTLFDIL